MEDSSQVPADVGALLEAAARLAALPDPLAEGAAYDFLSAWPLPALITLLQGAPGLEAAALDSICRVLARILATAAGKKLVADNKHYLHSALLSSEYQIRQLGVKQLGALLTEQQQQHDSDSAAALAAMLADKDVGVAAAAENALLDIAKSGPDGLNLVTSDASGGCGAKLLQLTASDSRSEVRLRVLGTGSALAAISAEALAAVERAGLLGSLIAELQNPSDVLSCAAALEVLQDIASASATTGNAAAVAEVFGPVVQRLLAAPQPGGPPAAEPFLVCQALKVSGSLLSSSSESGSHSPTSHRFSDSFLQAAAQLLSMARMGGDEVPGEVHQAAMEAVAAAGQHSLGAEKVMRWQASDRSIVQLLAWEALGHRSGHGEVRLVSLHALGTLAGAERMGQAGSLSGYAILSDQAEASLRSAVQTASPEGDVTVTNGWVDVLWALFQQPFPELRVACYRLASALALRGWAAEQICGNNDLRERICDPRSESGQQGSQWRYAVLQSLVAGLHHSAAGSIPNGDGGACSPPPESSVLQQLLQAMDLGPYGAGVSASAAHTHHVATVPR